MNRIENLLKFVKIEHTLFSLPVVFSGAVLAQLLHPEIHLSTAKIFWIFLAVTFARAYGFGVNRVLDADIDALNPRTQQREIPSGKISKTAGWIFSVVSAVLFILAAAQISTLCAALALIPTALFTLYPLFKRFTWATHWGLGLAWGVGPLGGWFAARQEFLPLADLTPAFLLFGFALFWVAGFDVIYALLDEKFDAEHRIHSFPGRFGAKAALWASEISHVLALGFLAALVHFYLPGATAYLFLFTIAFLFLLSHLAVRFKELTPAVIDFAFFKINAVQAFVVFALIWSGGLS